MNSRSKAALRTMLTLLILMTVLLPGAHAADKLADGSYTIGYTALKAENDSVSMANDYWEKPAELVVKDGQMTMKMRLNHSKWVTVFKVESSGGFTDTDIVSQDEAEDTRTVQFKLDDLSKPLISKIHVTVKEVDYDHDYTIRFVFDSKSLKQVEAAKPAADQAQPAAVSANAASKSPANQTPVSAAAAINPKTGDFTPLALLLIVLGMSLFMLVRAIARKN